MTGKIKGQKNLDLMKGEAVRLIIKDSTVTGVLTQDGQEVSGKGGFTSMTMFASWAISQASCATAEP
jgi:tRNA U34 5-carboxymethylaminomethyl modifying enzyme MnmG/GidA